MPWNRFASSCPPPAVVVLRMRGEGKKGKSSFSSGDLIVVYLGSSMRVLRGLVPSQGQVSAQMPSTLAASLTAQCTPSLLSLACPAGHCLASVFVVSSLNHAFSWYPWRERQVCFDRCCQIPAPLQNSANLHFSHQCVQQDPFSCPWAINLIGKEKVDFCISLIIY
jgi:hypothetical protein